MSPHFTSRDETKRCTSQPVNTTPTDAALLDRCLHFENRESNYSTRAHESVHWTKHESRLNRSFDSKRFGDQGYAMEELTAELGAAFLSADLGITPEVMPEHARYLDAWLKVLKEDKRAVFQAAAHAQRAVDFLYGLQPAAGVTEIPEQGDQP